MRYLLERNRTRCPRIVSLALASGLIIPQAKLPESSSVQAATCFTGWQGLRQTTEV